jgi:hypothetical protein
MELATSQGERKTMKNTMPVIPNAVRDLTNSPSHGARKNRLSKTILVFLALGLISCAFCVQQAQADSNVITFAGGLELGDIHGNQVYSVNDATQVIGWLDEMNNAPTVQSVSGVFFTFGVMVGDSVMFTPTWSFNSGPITAFWQVDGFTFHLVASQVVFNNFGFLSVSGSGYITGPEGYRQGGGFRFTTQDDPANGVFSFSMSSIPDGGATVALLGLALAGIEGIRRKLRRTKSAA